jgi:hypothetical protein
LRFAPHSGQLVLPIGIKPPQYLHATVVTSRVIFSTSLIGLDRSKPGILTMPSEMLKTMSLLPRIDAKRWSVSVMDKPSLLESSTRPLFYLFWRTGARG